MNRCTAVLAILMFLVLTGCGGEKAMPPPDKGTDVQPRDVPAPPLPTPAPVPSGAADQVTVYFATDRAEFVPTPWSYAGEFFWALGVFLGGLLLLRSLAHMTKDEFRGRVRVLWILWGVGVALLVANGVYECVDIQQDLERQGRLFGGERFITPFATGGEPELEDVLQFGSCTVTIPPDRVIGEVSRPSFWKADWFEDPAAHNVALDVERKRADAFFAEVKAVVAQSTDQDAFVFVHGYNVSFEDAVIRTGQIAYDLDFQGAAIAYSWPSQGQKGKYTVDEANVGWTVEHLHRFLLTLEQEIGAKKIHLIA
ncbi:MAG: alpha/beta hydrolase, partial [Planctomycetota bacterium]|nr:alpha/beta hydrolase [Planctomycetota bacterium]